MKREVLNLFMGDKSSATSHCFDRLPLLLCSNRNVCSSGVCTIISEKSRARLRSPQRSYFLSSAYTRSQVTSLGTWNNCFICLTPLSSLNKTQFCTDRNNQVKMSVITYFEGNYLQHRSAMATFDTHSTACAFRGGGVWVESQNRFG